MIKIENLLIRMITKGSEKIILGHGEVIHVEKESGRSQRPSIGHRDQLRGAGGSTSSSMNRVLRTARTALVHVQIRNASVRASSDKGIFEYLMISVPVVSFGLGVWQVYRWRWKLDLLEKLETRVRKAEPVDLPKDIEDYDTWEYRKVKVKGRFDHSKEAYVGPKHRFDSGKCRFVCFRHWVGDFYAWFNGSRVAKEWRV